LSIVITIDGPAVLRWLLALLFIAAAVSKLANPTLFLGDLFAYRLPLPEALLRLTAIILPWLELLCGLLLLGNLWSDAALGLVLGMSLVFLAATAQAWARGLDIACGCLNLAAFGVSDTSPILHFLESARFAVFRNLLMIGCAVYLFRLERGQPAPIYRGPARE